MRLRLDRVESPLGTIFIVAGESCVHAVAFEGASPPAQLEPAADPLGASSRLRAYFAGDLQAIEDIPVDPQGTAFQRSVWNALRRIRVGTTTTYGQLAASLGKPSATRAVGMANGSNPIAIVIPCHRVIGANRTLTGYGGGLDRKRWLLEHEGVRLPFGARDSRSFTAFR